MGGMLKGAGRWAEEAARVAVRYLATVIECHSFFYSIQFSCSIQLKEKGGGQTLVANKGGGRRRIVWTGKKFA